MESGGKPGNRASDKTGTRANPPTRPDSKALTLAVRCWGIVCGLALVKFGNPVIMEGFVSWPSDGFEWLLSPWPLTLGYGLVALALGLSLRAMPGRRGWNPRWLALAPAAWLAWQCLSALDTVDRALTRLTLPHFIVCGACFFAGYKLLALRPTLRGFWAVCAAALLWVLAYGVDQRFRGLPETRAFILEHEATHWQNFPPEERSRWERSGVLIRTAEGWTAHPMLLEKARSLRISSTLFYPNTLAGALLLFGPPVLWAVATTPLLTTGARALMGSIVGGGALACLYWSGSRSGWLVALGLGLVTFLVWPWPRTTKLAVLTVLTVLGLGVFAFRHAAFFQRGAPSVVARLDYWEAAWHTAWEHPWLGTGPGTFQRPYEQRKRPESEMARLAHNDYLQQASDSGWPAALFYGAWVWGGLIWTGRRLWRQPAHEGFFVWLGLLGWAVQSCVEFNLYIPALAWPAFLWLGWLAGGTGENDSTKPAHPA
jgi:O-antigen ligase